MIRPVGIDLGTSSIKLIELQDKKGKLELLKCAASVITGKDVKTSLKDLLAFSKLSSKRANVSLSGPSVIVRYIEMPPMNKEELRSAIKFEGGKYIPFDIKDAILDSTVLGKSPSGAANKVLLVAAKKDRVNECMEMFKDIGLDIASIDVDAMAIFNSFHRLGLETRQESVYAMVNIGARFSNVNIVSSGCPSFTRDVIWGGADLANKIKEVSGVSQDEAEALKRSPGERKTEIAGVITPALQKFISEIRLSFDYFETQFGKNVERVYISGGTAYLFNMQDFLKEDLGTEIVLWNPLEGVKILDESVDKSLMSSPAQFAVAMGLALRK